jgi:hypothetical protein
MALEKVGCPSRKKLKGDRELVMEAAPSMPCASDMIWCG